MEAIVLPFVLFAAAAIASTFGQGGGSLYTPVQLWLGIEPHTAAATSLLLIVVTSLSATLVFHQTEHTDWTMCLVLETPTLLGALGAAHVARLLPGTVLVVLLCVLLLLAGLLMTQVELANPRRRWNAAEAPPRPWYWARSRAGEQYRLNLLVTTPVMFVIGFGTSMVGLGGGILKLPAMVLLFRVPIRIAVGSSALMVGITALAGLAGHVAVGHLQWRLQLLWCVVAVFVGAQIGSRFSHRLSKQRLQTWFGWFLIATAVATLIRTGFSSQA